MFVFVEVFKYMISTTKWSSIIIVNMGIGLRIEITFAPNFELTQTELPGVDIR